MIATLALIVSLSSPTSFGNVTEYDDNHNPISWELVTYDHISDIGLEIDDKTTVVTEKVDDELIITETIESCVNGHYKTSVKIDIIKW